MCTKCNKSKKVYTAQLDSVATTYFSMLAMKGVNCDITLGEIEDLCEKMKCLKGKIKLKQFNSFQGILNSMKNTGIYCSYDVQPIIELLKCYECY